MSTGTGTSQRFRPRLAVGQHVRAADLDDAPGARGRVQRGDQVVEHVANGDGLNARVEPARADHHRQALGQVADDFERQAAGAHDHWRAKLRHRHAGFAQHGAGFLARTQMFGEGSVGVAQAAQIDDALDASRFGGRRKIPRGQHIPLLEVAPARHAVDQVERHLHALQGAWQGVGPQAIAGRHFRLAEPRPALQPRRVTRQAAHAKASLQQTRHEPPADVAGRARDENCSGRCHDVRSDEKKARATAGGVKSARRLAAPGSADRHIQPQPPFHTRERLGGLLKLPPGSCMTSSTIRGNLAALVQTGSWSVNGPNER